MKKTRTTLDAEFVMTADVIKVGVSFGSKKTLMGESEVLEYEAPMEAPEPTLTSTKPLKGTQPLAGTQLETKSLDVPAMETQGL